MDVQDGFEERVARRLIHDEVVVFGLTLTGRLLWGRFEMRPELTEVHVPFGRLGTCEGVDEGDLIEGVVSPARGELQINGNVIDAYIVPMTVLGYFCGEVGGQGGF